MKRFLLGLLFLLATPALAQKPPINGVAGPTTSTQLRSIITDPTGTGSSVFAVSPALTSIPTAPTAAYGTSTTQLATTAFVQAAIPAIIPSVACDATTDDTAGINAAILTASTNIRAIVQLPAGVCIVTGITMRANVRLAGMGLGVTYVRMKASTTANAVVAGLNAYTLFGTGSYLGIDDWEISDLTIDGNKAAGGASDCLGVYGWAWRVRNVEMQNCSGFGIRTQYPIAVDGSLPNHGDNASSWFENNLVHDNDLGGVNWAGPQDSSFIGNYVYRNLVYNMRVYSAAVGLKAVNSHFWGSLIGVRQPVTGILIEAINTFWSNSTSEGATGQQVWIKATNTVVMGGRYYYASATPNTVYCFRLGDTAGVVSAAATTIYTQTTDCQSGSVFFDSDGGLNDISIAGFNGSATSTGYTGTPGGFSYYNIAISGTSVTAATLQAVAAPWPLTSGGTGATTAAGARTALGLGTAATANTGTSGATLPFLNGNNFWSGANSFFPGTIFLAGASSGAIQLNTASAVASGTLLFPNGPDTMAGAASLTTFTNKTFDTAATGNSFSINGVAVTANTGTGAVARATSPTFVTPVLGAAAATSVNGATITATTGGTLTLANSSSLVTSGANSITLTSTGATNVTLPTTGTLVTSAGPTFTGTVGADSITATGTIRANTAFNANGTPGASATVVVRDNTGGANCDLVFTLGLYTSTTCPP